MERTRRDTDESARLHLELPALPQSVAVARARIAALGEVDGGALDALLIVVSELVTNAVRHAGLSSGQMLTLRAARLHDRVRVEVVDHGEGFDPARVMRIEPTIAGGYGLRIVARLSERWGTEPDSGTVWAEVATPGTRTIRN